MLFRNSDVDYSTLPQADNNRASQELSLRAFRNALPVRDWVVRDERIEDAGVDASMELLIEGRYTNLRSQVQLKSTSHPQENEDNSVSLPIKVSNLKYLLNGQSPFYVLYIIPRDELRFVWARDERRRLDTNNPNWEEQETVTLRFVEQLTPATLSNVRERISQESRFIQQLHETLGHVTVGEMVRICVDTETLRASNPQQLLQLLIEQGILLVNAGRSCDVIEATHGLNPIDMQRPRVQLVVGYAYYMQSQFASAIAALTQAQLKISQLSEDDQQFVRYLRGSCDFHTGRISFEEFNQNCERWLLKATHSFATALRLTQLRQNLYASTDIKVRRSHVDYIRQEITHILESSDYSLLIKGQAYNLWLYAEGTQLSLEEFDRWGKDGMRLKMGQPIDPIATAQVIQQNWKVWHDCMQSVFNTAESLNHPLFMAEVRYNRAHITLTHVTNAQLLAIVFSAARNLPIPSSIASLMEDANEAERLYEQVGMIEGTQQAKLLKAQIMLITEQESEAHTVATEVLPVAQAMQYTVVEKHARLIINGQTPLQALIKNTAERAKMDEDVIVSSETDEEMRFFAFQQLENLELPAERLPVLEREAFSMRGEARERVSWCQHISIIQDTTHTKSKQTLYQHDPNRFGQCNRLGYRSIIGDTDWQAVLRAFKDTYCSKCEYRQPKQTAQEVH